jgi:hypothetical protein
MNVKERLDRLDNSVASEPVVQVVLQALSEGHARKAVIQFSDQFAFHGQWARADIYRQRTFTGVLH